MDRPFAFAVFHRDTTVALSAGWVDNPMRTDASSVSRLGVGPRLENEDVKGDSNEE